MDSNKKGPNPGLTKDDVFKLIRETLSTGNKKSYEPVKFDVFTAREIDPEFDPVPTFKDRLVISIGRAWGKQ